MLITLEQAMQRMAAFAETLAPVNGVHTVPLASAASRILATDVLADRDQPPFDRSTRDGFAVASADVAAQKPLICVGELPAGRIYPSVVSAGHCVQIMTGAPMPQGTDSVVMVEHTSQQGDAVVMDKRVEPGENVVPQGAEARAGDVVLSAGAALDAAALGLLASVGAVNVQVNPLPSAAVLTTGDEIVPVESSPAKHEIRNSNAYMLSAAVAQAGGLPQVLPPVIDDRAALLQALQAALCHDIVLITGGVSKGKYDHVKEVLGELNAHVIFAGVAIRPGKPVVLAAVPWQGRTVAVLALPGNPLSTLVTFLLFGRPLLARLGGAALAPPDLVWLPVESSLAWRPIDFTAFVPARLCRRGLHTALRISPSAGSGDLVAAASADGFARIEAGAPAPREGEWAAFLPKG